MKLESLLPTDVKKKLAKLQGWDRPKILMSREGFQAIHAQGYNNCNREAGLLEYMTVYSDVKRIRVSQSKGTFHLYIQYAVTDNPQGHERRFRNGEEDYVLIVRKDGKTNEIYFRDRDADKRDFRGDNLSRYLDDISRQSLKDAYLRHELEELSGHDLSSRDLPEYVKTNRVRVALERCGWKVLECVPFHESLWLRPQFVDVKGSVIEFGIMTNHTYHSLPAIIRFDFLPNLRTAKLADLGVEERGNYDHHARHTVRKDQIPAVKRFHARFQRKQRTMPDLRTKARA